MYRIIYKKSKMLSDTFFYKNKALTFRLNIPIIVNIYKEILQKEITVCIRLR